MDSYHLLRVIQNYHRFELTTLRASLIKYNWRFDNSNLKLFQSLRLKKMTNSLVYFRLSICLFSILSKIWSKTISRFFVFLLITTYKMTRLTRTLLIMADKAKMVAQSRTVLKLRVFFYSWIFKQGFHYILKLIFTLIVGLFNSWDGYHEFQIFITFFINNYRKVVF